MTGEDIKRIAETILGMAGANGFALVISTQDQTIVLLNNVSSQAAGELLCEASRDIGEGEQRPALFN